MSKQAHTNHVGQLCGLCIQLTFITVFVSSLCLLKLCSSQQHDTISINLSTSRRELISHQRSPKFQPRKHCVKVTFTLSHNLVPSVNTHSLIREVKFLQIYLYCQCEINNHSLRESQTFIDMESRSVDNKQLLVAGGQLLRAEYYTTWLTAYDWPPCPYHIDRVLNMLPRLFSVQLLNKDIN